MEILKIKIEIGEVVELKGDVIVKMISFTGKCRGKYFNGEILPGGVDTQKLDACGNGTLSARYVLKGVDCEQNACSVYIENNGTIEHGTVGETTPVIIPDSPVFNRWKECRLYGRLFSDETEFYVCIHAEE